jgi:predicted molibdopterin-dependent oxidoreductase YjgC
MHVEQDGSFTNVQGICQAFKKAMEPVGEAKSAGELAQLLLARLAAPKAPGATK